MYKTRRVGHIRPLAWPQPEVFRPCATARLAPTRGRAYKTNNCFFTTMFFVLKKKGVRTRSDSSRCRNQKQKRHTKFFFQQKCSWNEKKCPSGERHLVWQGPEADKTKQGVFFFRQHNSDFGQNQWAGCVRAQAMAPDGPASRTRPPEGSGFRRNGKRERREGPKRQQICRI